MLILLASEDSGTILQELLGFPGHGPKIKDPKHRIVDPKYPITPIIRLKEDPHCVSSGRFEMNLNALDDLL